MKIIITMFLVLIFLVLNFLTPALADHGIVGGHSGWTVPQGRSNYYQQLERQHYERQFQEQQRQQREILKLQQEQNRLLREQQRQQQFQYLGPQAKSIF